MSVCLPNVLFLCRPEFLPLQPRLHVELRIMHAVVAAHLV